MLSQVRAWQPPTSDHGRLKEFMEKRITQSIDFGRLVYGKRPELNPGVEWLAGQLHEENRILWSLP